MSFTLMGTPEKRPNNLFMIFLIAAFVAIFILMIGKAFAETPNCYSSGYHSKLDTDYQRFDDLSEAVKFMIKNKGELFINNDADGKRMGWVVGYKVYVLVSNDLTCGEL